MGKVKIVVILGEKAKASSLMLAFNQI